MFSANTLHIMGWDGVEAFFRGVGQVLEREGGTLVVYGPFNHDGGYTSDSNRDFDAWLKARDPRSGIRDFRSEEHTSELQSLMRISYAVFCLKKKKNSSTTLQNNSTQ